MRSLLIDSNYLCYRAKMTTGHLQYHGVGTGVMFGFFNQLLTISQHTKPDQIIFFWDSRKNLRKEILPTYKAKRRDEQSPEEIAEWNLAFREFNNLRKYILPQIGFNNNFFQRGYESDDLIAQYVFNKGRDEDIIIATGDDDLLQLLNGNTSIYNPAKELTVTKKDFIKKWSIQPYEWAYVKQIAGCKSDNVPGIPGVGEKKAIQYIKGEMKETTKTFQKIKDGKELIEFNRQLVVLPFVDTMNPVDRLVKNKFKMIDFLRFAREYGMHSFRTDDKKEQVKSHFK